MSDPFVGPVPMRWEFDTLLNNLSAAAGDLPLLRSNYENARAEVVRAFDAQSARIAELESPAHRAKVVREFEAEVDAEWFGESSAPSMNGIRTNVLARWEAAAKEGE